MSNKPQDAAQAGTRYVVTSARPVQSRANNKWYTQGQEIDLAHLKRHEREALVRAKVVAAADSDAAKKAIEAARAAAEE